MSARSLAGSPSPSACAEDRPEISWIPDWLDREALATLGPFAGFATALVAAFTLAMAFQEPLRRLPFRFLGPLAVLSLVSVVVLVFLVPHWWAWRVCGPRGKGKFLGAALWFAHFPSLELGESARALAASALCAGDYLGVCAADNLGILALALHVARAGDAESPRPCARSSSASPGWATSWRGCCAATRWKPWRRCPLRRGGPRSHWPGRSSAVGAALATSGWSPRAPRRAGFGAPPGVRPHSRPRPARSPAPLLPSQCRPLRGCTCSSSLPPSQNPDPGAPRNAGQELGWPSRLGGEGRAGGPCGRAGEGSTPELALMAGAARGEWPAEGENGLAASLRARTGRALYALLERKRRFDGSENSG